MSDVERYYNAIRAKWPEPLPDWHNLGIQRQQMVIQSINILIHALHMR